MRSGITRWVAPWSFFHAADADHVAAGAGDLRAHRHQAVGQVDDLGLAGGVLDDGLAVGQAALPSSGFGAGDGDHVGEDAGALQARHLACT